MHGSYIGISGRNQPEALIPLSNASAAGKNRPGRPNPAPAGRLMGQSLAVPAVLNRRDAVRHDTAARDCPATGQGVILLCWRKPAQALVFRCPGDVATVTLLSRRDPK